jgi:hypothetical protein
MKICPNFIPGVFLLRSHLMVKELQEDINKCVEHYNNNRTHQGKRCQGRTPMDTFIASLGLARQKNLDKEFNGVSDTCQL